MMNLFRRDMSHDRRWGRLLIVEYRLLWPDGRAVAVGLDAFCRYGRHLLGLDRHPAGVNERHIEILRFPDCDPDGPMTRLPGHSVCRFFLHRKGPGDRPHFQRTKVDFFLGRDELSVVELIGLANAPNPARLRLDLPAPSGRIGHGRRGFDVHIAGIVARLDIAVAVPSLTLPGFLICPLREECSRP